MCNYIYTEDLLELTAQSAGAVEYTNCITAEGVRPPPIEYPGYDNKQSDGEAPVMLELWGIQSTPSLTLLLSPFWPGVLAPDRVLSMGQIELFDYFNYVRTNDEIELLVKWSNSYISVSKQMIDVKLNC